MLDGPVGGWLHQLRQAVHPPASPEAIVYRLDFPVAPGSPFIIDLRVVRILKSGEWGADRALPSQQLQNPTANYLTPADRAIIRLLGRRNVEFSAPSSGRPRDRRFGDAPDLSLPADARWQNLASPPLALGPGRPGRLAWQVGADGQQTVGDRARRSVSCRCFPRPHPGMCSPAEHLAGPIELELARPLVRVALSAPPVTKAQAEAVGAAPRPRTAGPRVAAAALRHRGRDPPRSAGPGPDARSAPARLELLGGAHERLGRQCRSGAARAFLTAALRSTRTTGETSCALSRRGGSVVRRRNRSSESSALKRLQEFGLRDRRNLRGAGPGRRSSCLRLCRGAPGLAGFCVRRRAAASNRGLADRIRGRLSP